MPESGGSATQAGILYQNSIAALALADLLDLDQRSSRERVLEVRIEAPAHVDDLVISYADGHRDFQTVKLSLRVGCPAWNAMWRDLSDQAICHDFIPTDQLTIVVDQRTAASDAIMLLCERAAASVDRPEFFGRLSDTQMGALTSVEKIAGSEVAAFELLRRTRILHSPMDSVENDFGRRRLAGSLATSPSLLPILRDMANGAARRRGIFQAAPLRRRLKLEHDILLGEPPEWGLDAYRAAIARLARLEVPGTNISERANKLFVWPRARELDPSRPTDFEDENNRAAFEEDEMGLDLKSFPSDQFERLVIVAGPGHGKSALLTAFVERLADGPLVPVSVPLASFASVDANLLQFLGSTLNKELDVSADWPRLAEQGLLVLLLDGLDEVPAAARPEVMRRLSMFSARYPLAPWILTVRDAAVLTGLPEATVVELMPLSDSDIERFAQTMQKYMGKLTPWELVLRLRLYPDLHRLARIPLFLMLLLTTTDLENPQPLTRGDLIETYLSTLFSPERHKSGISSQDHGPALRGIAEILAFERLERQEIGATEREVRDIVGRVAQSPAEAEMLMERLRANGILKPQSAIRLQFPYPVVQEYLAARHLVERYPDSLGQRIEDAIQRPWAQVIQFAIELHPEPEPIIEQMLTRSDDAFATGLRLVGRCIANGARVSDALRLEVGERLVDYWEGAPSKSRERVGRLMVDGFANIASAKLDAALHHRWLIEDGAGDILAERQDTALTLSVLRNLLHEGRGSLGMYHGLKRALSAAGDAAMQTIIDSMDPETNEFDGILTASGFFWHFSPGSVSRDLTLSVAQDERLPAQVRLRAYRLLGSPADEAAVELALTAFRGADWERNYAAADIIEIHADPEAFFEQLVRDETISADRREKIAADIGTHIKPAPRRSELAQRLIADPGLESEIRNALRLMEARHGNLAVFTALVDELPTLPIDVAGTTIALFGHHPDRMLAERAAELIAARDLSHRDIVRIANNVTTGMRYIFEMDFGYGGALHATHPHAGIGAWLTLLEDWCDIRDFDVAARFEVRTIAADLGSDVARALVESDLLAIEDFDAPEWTAEDRLGHNLSSALRRLRRRRHGLPDALVDRALASSRYNIASSGVAELEARGNRDALVRLIELHVSAADWHLRDLVANTIELLAARLQLVIRKSGEHYTLD